MSSLHWKEIEIRYRGKPVKGRFNVSDKLVTVAAWNGTKTGQLVPSNPWSSSVDFSPIADPDCDDRHRFAIGSSLPEQGLSH